MWLYRQLLSSGVWMLPDAQRLVFITLLLVANWKTTEVPVHGRRVVVRRGQALITARRLAEKARVSKGAAERAIASLRELKVIRTDPAYQVEVEIAELDRGVHDAAVAAAVHPREQRPVGDGVAGQPREVATLDDRLAGHPEGVEVRTAGA